MENLLKTKQREDRLQGWKTRVWTAFVISPTFRRSSEKQSILIRLTLVGSFSDQNVDALAHELDNLKRVIDERDREYSRKPGKDETDRTKSKDL